MYIGDNRGEISANTQAGAEVRFNNHLQPKSQRIDYNKTSHANELYSSRLRRLAAYAPQQTTTQFLGFTDTPPCCVSEQFTKELLGPACPIICPNVKWL